MDIADIVSGEYVALSPDTPVSKLVGAFDDPTVKGVVVHGDEFEGIVTRRQLATSHHQPDEKVGSLVWHVPRLAPDEDIRKVAQLMIDSDAQLLPVFDGGELAGVVTVDAILEKVRPFLDAATVAEASTADLVTLDPESTFGEALHVFRENRITHLPVVEDDTAIGILSLYDVTDLTVRSAKQSQGGDAGGTDSFGGDISASSGRAHGGFGAREGELARILDLPVRDVMVSPVRTIYPDATLETAVEEMFAIGGSSLVVTEDGRPFGIVTKTDVLDSLTWEAGGNRAVQVYGTDLLDDVQYEDVVAMIEKFDDRDHGMSVLDAKIHLHEHDEKLRGTPLLLARIRLHTDRGLYIASGEGYGASHALNEARDVLERQIRDRKTYGESKKPQTKEFWEKRFGWMLE
ncbi:CBS domain-containing protein [Haloplanus rubicundus]|uniref:CBS domain-containing protein n=1 Tax=Haloplanus rubicundus TaxID=1547898 RepID=A0A345EC86_9EURY|nr:CBS domain-containing protein [Haloplanus rubicundus]AXG06389.1 CBS domain-containing protein [Haloplanus rubicundus]AXG09808.1 CBS domain-containing protein [Haloplanus rubicundus]